MIFIVGVGRSGTSLIQSMLNAHPDIAFIPEINYIRRFLATQTLERIAKRAGVNGLIELLLKDNRLQRLEIDLKSLLEWVDPQSRELRVDIYRAILQKHLKNEGKTIPGDKDPRSVEYLAVIAKYFPKAYIVHIIRDPRDILLSKMNAEWSRDRSVYLHVLANKVQLMMGMQEFKLFGERYIEIKYEELLADPEKTLKRLCEDLGIQYHDSMLDYTDSSRKLVADDEMAWKKETLGPLLKSNVGKWKNGLSSWNVAMVEELVDIAFDHYDYVKSKPQLRVGQRVIITLIKPLFHAVTVLRRAIK